MKILFFFFVSVVYSLRPAFRAATTIVRPSPIRSLHTLPTFPWIATPGKRFVELVLLSGDVMIGELDENMTIEQVKLIAMDQFKYRDVFDVDQIDFVGRLIYGPKRSESMVSKHHIPMTDKTELVQVAPPLGVLLQLSVVSRVLPDAGRHSFLLHGIEQGLLRTERLKAPRYRSATTTSTMSPNITTEAR